MDVTPEQAADALREVARARSRSIEAYSYRVSAPQVMLWGFFWIVGYGLSDLYPAQAGYVWSGIGAIWALQGFLYNRSASRKAGAASGGAAWRFIAIFLTIYVFIGSTVAIMRPHGIEMGAFVPMLVAAAYTIIGLWLGWRYSAIGVAVAALTLGGFFLLPAHFLLWMAFVGGGALILTGLWLRSA